MCSLVTHPKLLASGISSLVSSFPVMMGSQRCAKKLCAEGATLTLARYTTHISKYHHTNTHTLMHAQKHKATAWKVLPDPETLKFSGTVRGYAHKLRHTVMHLNVLKHLKLLFFFWEEKVSCQLSVHSLDFHEPEDIYCTLEFLIFQQTQ